MSAVTTAVSAESKQFTERRMQIFRWNPWRGYDVEEVDDWIDHEVVPTLEYYEGLRDAIAEVAWTHFGDGLELQRSLLQILGIAKPIDLTDPDRKFSQ